MFGVEVGIPAPHSLYIYVQVFMWCDIMQGLFCVTLRTANNMCIQLFHTLLDGGYRCRCGQI